MDVGLIIGLVIIAGSLIIAIFYFIDKKNSQNRSDKTHIADSVSQEAIDNVMGMYQEIAMRIDEINNYEKYKLVLRKKLKLLQDKYDNSLKGLDKILLALGYYYILDAYKIIVGMTGKMPTAKMEADILGIISRSLNSPLLNENPNAFMFEIVLEYFSNIAS